MRSPDAAQRDFAVGCRSGVQNEFASPWAGSAEQREGALRRVRDTKPIASPLNKARRAFFDIGTHRLKLVGASDQLLLLDGLG